ncbi:MAG: bacillithiol system redox-active protein YtxJ [Bacteroidetes bacterium]|nr:MAG: bacillithiol system redox-active protein YtxJ [Bacteroidota bacterium]
MNWQPLTSQGQLADLVTLSAQQPCLIFKHSTSCSISALAKTRLERHWKLANTQVVTYYLDLLAQRELSSRIASQFGVRHESPQVLLIRDGRCVYDASHLSISVEAIEEALDC